MTGITHQYVPVSGSPATLASYSYSYNAAGEITSQTNSDGTLNYVYDATGQLTTVSGAFSESYSYDVNGNRSMAGWTTGTANRLTSDGLHNYAYDAEGNLLTKTRTSDSQRWEFTWDYRNRLTQALEKTSGGTVVKQANYVYDVFNRRIGSTVDADGAGSAVPTTRWTMYDGPGLGAPAYIDWIDPDGSGPQSPALDSRRLSASVVDTVLARWTASTGTVAWYLTDQLGTVRDVANNSGTVLNHINYDSFGKIRSESNPSNGDRFKFTGYEHDSETGLYQARARSYDPATGRFVSIDPIGLAGGDANLYRYVENAPTIRVDPLGLAYVAATHPYSDPTDPEAYAASCGLDSETLAKAIAAWRATPSGGAPLRVSMPFINPNMGQNWFDVALSWSPTMGSIGTGCLPIAGELQDIQQAITGQDWWTDERLTGSERCITGAAVFFPLVGGSFIRRVLRCAGQVVTMSDEVVDIATTTSHIAIPDQVRAGRGLTGFRTMTDHGIDQRAREAAEKARERARVDPGDPWRDEFGRDTRHSGDGLY